LQTEQAKKELVAAKAVRPRIARECYKLTIRPFKSIRNLDNFELKSLNICIGSNGSGKSNLISFFYMLKALMEEIIALKCGWNWMVNGLFFMRSQWRISFIINFDKKISGC